MSVQIEISNYVAVVKMDRPSAKNAMNAEMGEGLINALKSADESNDVRVILLTGHEDFFCTGADIKEVSTNPPSKDNATALNVFKTIVDVDKPIVACVSGLAVGAGATIPFLCDVVYADENTQFSYPFTNLGICPEAGSSLTLPALIGYQRAAELLLFGDPIDAPTALSLGLVANVYDANAALESALNRCQQLAQKAPSSLKAVKKLMRAPFLDQLNEHLDREFEMLAKMFVGADAREAFTAMAERRKPNFG